MPFAHLSIAAPALTATQIGTLQRGITALLENTLRKRAEVTAVLVETTPPGAWSIGGEPAPLAAHLEVKITAGTNDADQKAHFLAAADTLLREVLGEALPVATYVVIHEVPADAWGYGGVSQAARRQARL